jgi:uncharacterized protein YecT (DUF1311 family)
MNSMFNSLLAGVVVLASQSVLAQGECDQYTTSYDRTYCFSKLLVESDKELNSVYNELRNLLKGTARSQLIEAQRAWINYRDQKCQPSSGTILVDCNYEVNRKRADSLRDRWRECKTGNCREDMIGSRNWD